MSDETEGREDGTEGRGKVVSCRARPKRGCPICGRPASARYRPFCSRRCADVDLNRWFSGRYAVPTEEAPEEGGAGSEEE